MCGKFTQMMSWRKVHTYADFLRPVGGEDRLETVTPMRIASVICLDDSGARIVRSMRWGFARHSAGAPGARPEHIHARAETLDTKPTFREAFAQRRGIVAVTSFNEAKELSRTKSAQYVITPHDARPLGIAVLWERWSHPQHDEFFTFVMVTVPANPLIATITDRMPAVLAPADWPLWLGEIPATADSLKAILRPHGDACSMVPEPARAKASRAVTQPDLF